MMDDFHALNYLQKIPYRETKQRDEQSKVNTLLTKLQQQKQSQLISTTGDKQMQQNITHPKRKSTRRNKNIHNRKNNTTKMHKKEKNENENKNQKTKLQNRRRRNHLRG